MTKNIIKFSSCITFICFINCSFFDRKLEIERFEDAEYYYTIHDNIKGQVYLVTGYRDHESVDKQIDSFYCAMRDTSVEQNVTYFVEFLNKSKTTNKEFIKKDKKHFFYKSPNDIIYIYKCFRSVKNNKVICSKRHFPGVGVDELGSMVDFYCE